MSSNQLKQLKFSFNEEVVWPSLQETLTKLKIWMAPILSDAEYQKLEVILNKEDYMPLQQALLEKTVNNGIEWINDSWNDEYFQSRKIINAQTKVSFSYFNEKLNLDNQCLKAAIMIKLIAEQYLFYYKNNNLESSFFCSYRYPKYDQDQNYINYDFNNTILLMYQDHCFLLEVIKNNEVINLNAIYNTIKKIIKQYHKALDINFHYFDYGHNRDQVAITLKSMLEDEINLEQFNKVKSSIALISIDNIDNTNLLDNLVTGFLGNSKKINKWFGKGLIINITNITDIIFLIDQRFFIGTIIQKFLDNFNYLLNNINLSIDKNNKQKIKYQYLNFNIIQYEPILLKYQNEYLKYYSHFFYNQYNSSNEELIINKIPNEFSDFLFHLALQVSQLKTLKLLQNTCLKINIDSCWGLKTKCTQPITFLTKWLSNKVLGRNFKKDNFYEKFLLANEEHNERLQINNNRYGIKCHLWALEKIYHHLLKNKKIKQLKIFNNNFMQKINDYFFLTWSMNHISLSGFFYYPKNKDSYSISYFLNKKIYLIIVGFKNQNLIINQFLDNFDWASKRIIKILKSQNQFK